MNHERMRIVIAPDSFKGSLSARDLCAAFAAGVRRVLPDAMIAQIPLADGGEGTMETLVAATNGSFRTAMVTGPLGTKVSARYGVLGDGKTAVIEMAQASGLPLVPPDERNPLVTTTYGTGELISHALEEGYRRLLIGLGGSATHDGGTGMLRALGVRFYDPAGRELPPGGGSLQNLARYDDSGLDVRLRETTVLVACDVTNPMVGPNGAAAVFALQKGATPELLPLLDSALDRFGAIVLGQSGREIRHLPGGGAAGGMGAALIAFLNAKLQPGIELVMDAADLDGKLEGADLLLTGEGRLDAQTLSGKVIAGVCARAQRRQVPVVALCGSVAVTGEQMDELGLLAALPLAPGPCTLDEAMINAAAWAADRAEQVLRLTTCRRAFS